MSEIRVRFDEELLPLLGDSPEEIEQHALEMIVLELYRRHTISAGRAAELLGMEKFAFIRWTGELGIPFFDMTPEEWQEELRVLEKL
jgi:predicted HTH domain antitoxin